MAEALESLFPEVKFGIGPPIENGFYYDVDLGEKSFGEEDLVALEKKMLACPTVRCCRRSFQEMIIAIHLVHEQWVTLDDLAEQLKRQNPLWDRLTFRSEADNLVPGLRGRLRRFRENRVEAALRCARRPRALDRS